jgi:hypothetical protein
MRATKTGTTRAAGKLNRSDGDVRPAKTRAFDWAFDWTGGCERNAGERENGSESEFLEHDFLPRGGFVRGAFHIR